jgi:hypothetical protein
MSWSRTQRRVSTTSRSRDQANGAVRVNCEVWRVIPDRTVNLYPRSISVAYSKCRKSLATFNVALAVILIHSSSNYFLHLENVRLGITIVRLAPWTVATVITCCTIAKDDICHRSGGIDQAVLRTVATCPGREEYLIDSFRNNPTTSKTLEVYEKLFLGIFMIQVKFTTSF